MRERIRGATEYGDNLAPDIDVVVVGVADLRRVYAVTHKHDFAANESLVPYPVAAHHEIVFPFECRIPTVLVHGD